MPGFVPGIHALNTNKLKDARAGYRLHGPSMRKPAGVDGRDKPGHHDVESRCSEPLV